MRIMTWNIHGTSLGDREERFPLIKAAVEMYQHDVACFQEAFFLKSRKMLKSIEGYHVSYQLNWLRPPSTKGGLVTLTKETSFDGKPLEVSFNPYHSQGNWFTEQRWDRLLGKGFLETIVKNEECGKITVINTHKVCTYTQDTDKYLEAQTQQLLRKIRQRKEKGERIVVAGDFNFKRKSNLYPQFKELLHDATEGLHDAAESFHKLHLFEYETIDYIFTEDRYHCESASVYHESWQKYPSDHPCIMINTNFRKE